jgi:indolepyruvate decarboxylase
MNLAQSLLRALKACGVAEVFGIPGDFALPLFKVMEETRILPLYTLSHEPAVGFAADAAARFHSKPSVAAVTYGAGALNMVNPVAAAYSEKSPVVVVSGGPGMADRSTGLLLHHQAKHLNSQLEVYREVTCDQAILDDLRTAPEVIARVLHNCITQSRPVYLEVPRDLVFAKCAPVKLKPPGTTVDARALRACSDEILARVQAAESPVVVVDVEIRRFGLEAQVTQMCRKLGVPVVTTFMGRGLLAGQRVPFRGTYMGVAGDPDVTELVENSDCLLALGVIVSDTNFGISEKRIDLRRAILACDGKVTLGYHTYPDIPLPDLVQAVNRRLHRGRNYTAPAINYPRGLKANADLVTPNAIAAAVNDLFDRSGRMPIASDMGDCLFTALDIENTELVAPGYYATMGFGVPAGLGVQAATGKRPLIMVGDGAFQMTGWELVNCRRYGWNPIVLLFNNASWEMLRAFQPESKFNNLDDIRYADLAAGLGGRGHRVRTSRELIKALETAVRDDGSFHLVEIMLARGVLSRTLQRYVDGIKRMRAQK